MSKDKTPAEVELILQELQAALGANAPNSPWRCQAMEGKEGSCIARFSSHTKGGGKFWYAIDCPLAQKLCTACLAYWLIAVARNAVLTIQKERGQ